MSFSTFSEIVFERLSCRLTLLAQRWGVKPVSLIAGLKLWLGWAGLTWLAFLASLLWVEVGERHEVSWADGLLGGALIGLAQWQMLRPYLSPAYPWIMATTLGWGALALLNIGAIGWMAPGTPNLWFRGVFGIFYGGYVGLALGAIQWLVIRHQVKQAWRWMPWNAGAWAVAIALGWLIGGSLRALSHLFVSEVVGLGVAWGVIAALSGLGIVGLLFQQPSQPLWTPFVSRSSRQSPSAKSSASQSPANPAQSHPAPSEPST
ncbi:MAG: hypothetical protein HC800_02905 [Phormidesmis sp. RL_2_1]|nr:hypothetical protein [Phormidesmis sp. RL_2_1]